MGCKLPIGFGSSGHVVGMRTLRGQRRVPASPPPAAPDSSLPAPEPSEAPQHPEERVLGLTSAVEVPPNVASTLRHGGVGTQVPCWVTTGPTREAVCKDRLVQDCSVTQSQCHSSPTALHVCPQPSSLFTVYDGWGTALLPASVRREPCDPPAVSAPFPVPEGASQVFLSKHRKG